MATGLFVLQAIHLVWLFGDVILTRLTGHPLFGFTGIFKVALVIVDYTEIPALISVSLVYTHDLQKSFSWKSVWFLFALNIQWLHLFWITDEFVVATFTNKIIIPATFAWIAILIDYLEVPVIVATVRKFFVALRER